MFRTATWKANHKLAKSIADKGFYEFRRQLEYKCQWYSCELVVVVRFFPLSKTCSNFGHVQDMPLNVRIYDCPVCGISIDCDLNASINLRNAVGSTLNACGWVTADGLSWTRKYSRFTIELRQVFLAVKVFQGKNVSFLFKITININLLLYVMLCISFIEHLYQFYRAEVIFYPTLAKNAPLFEC